MFAVPAYIGLPEMSNVEKLESLYDRVDAVHTIVARATLTELVRESQRGLTDSQIAYWITRLETILTA